MAVSLNVLIVEDSEVDAELALYHLEKGGFKLTSQRVETAGEMENALRNRVWDIIISDFSLPAFDAPSALTVLQKSGLDIPFIVISGTITEDTAIGLMRAGAADYLMKDRLARLAPLVKRELAIMQVRKERVETQAALRKSQEWSDLIYNTTSDAMFLLAVEPGSQFRCLTVNAAYLKTTGLTEAQVIGKQFDEILPSQFIPYTLEKYLEAVRVGHAIQYEETANLSGRFIHVETTLTPITDQNGACIQLLGSSHDISERRLVEEKLKESETNFRSLFEQAAVGMAMTDARTGEFIKINRRFCEILGYTPEEMMSVPFTKVTHPDDVKKSVEKMELLLAGAIREFSMEKRYLRKDGNRVWVDINVSAMWEPGEAPTNYVTIVQEVTERKVVEKSLRQSEVKFSTAFRVSPDSININRLSDGLYIEINEGFTAMTGFTPEDVSGKTSLEINIWVNPQDREHLVWGLREKGEVTNFEASFRRKDGSVFIGLMSARMIEIDGEPCLLSITRNITGYKLKEKEYSTFIQTSFDGFWSVDQSGHFLDVNEALCQLLGYTREELLGMSIADIEVVEDPEAIAAHVQTIIRAGRDRFQTRHRRKDGKIIDVEISAQYLSMGQRFYVFIHDITESKRTEGALRESEYFFKETQRVGFVGSYKTNFVTGLWESSDVLNQIFGIDQTFVRSIPAWLDIVHPDDREMMDLYLREEVISRRKPFNKEYRIIRKSDGELRWVHGLGEVSFDHEGNPLTLIGTIHDISERKQVETKITEQLNELRRWHAATLGREERVLELKREVNRLLAEAGKPPRFASVEETA